MTTTKKSFSFRLSFMAQANLDQVVAITGMNQTAIVEYALAKMRADLTKGMKMERSSIIKNQHGVEIDMEAAANNMMDDDLREKLHAELAPCTKQKFFSAYAKAHLKKFGEEWELNKANPVW